MPTQKDKDTLKGCIVFVNGIVGITIMFAIIIGLFLVFAGRA